MDYTAIKNCLAVRISEAESSGDSNKVLELKRLLQKVEDNEQDYSWLDYED